MRVFLIAIFSAVACAPLVEDLPGVSPVAETTPVASRDDAADDPAIWINLNNPEASLILGTDKQSGVYAYDLKGNDVQFVPTGAVNNVDLRQGVSIGDWSGDVAAASNRSNNTIALYEITDGVIHETGAFPSLIEEPYGLCMGSSDGAVFVFVAHKTGALIAYELDSPQSGASAGRVNLETQLEGCVFDDETATLYIGEEERGIWKTSYAHGEFSAPQLVDEIGSDSGVAADVEGLAIYHGVDGRKLLVASSQGNNSYAVYDTADDRFLGRFAVVSGEVIDGAEETDGIEVTSIPLGASFPHGVLVVQDGYNRPRGERQNFKIVDWRDVEAVLSLRE